MKVKLGRPFDNTIITQSNHTYTVVDGTLAINTAFDFSKNSKLLALCDGAEVYGVAEKSDSRVPYANKQQSYFFVKFPDGSKQFVLHSLPIRTGKYNGGEVICNEPLPYWQYNDSTKRWERTDHYHSMIKVNGIWQVLLDYCDRTQPLWFWSDKQTHYKWTNWGTYTDRYLNFPDIIINDTPMIKPTFTDKLYKLTATHTVDPFNIRLEPKKDAKDIGDVPRNFVWLSNMCALTGDKDYPKWWSIIVPSGENQGTLGWVAANWVKEDISITSDAQAQIDALQLEKSKLQSELNKFKPLTSIVYEKSA